MATIKIEYAAKQDFNFDKAFKPSVFVNGKWVYTISRCKKTMRGALNAAKKLAEEYSTHYSSQYNNITISQKS